MWALIWLQPLIAVAGILLAGVAGLGRSWPRTGAWIQAAAVGVSAFALAFYVASEDDYRRGGISRWQAYDARELTVAAFALAGAAATGLVASALLDRRRLGGVAFLTSGGAGALTFAAFLANSLN